MEATDNKKTGTRLSCAMILACAIIGAGLMAADDEKDKGEHAAPRWQHLALTHANGDLKDIGDLGRRINELGRDGWELVTVEGFTTSGTTDKMVFFFKKRL